MPCRTDPLTPADVQELHRNEAYRLLGNLHKAKLLPIEDEPLLEMKRASDRHVYALCWRLRSLTHNDWKLLKIRGFKYGFLNWLKDHIRMDAARKLQEMRPLVEMAVKKRYPTAPL